MLRDAQDIAVGILEPGDLVARGRGPDADFGILDERIFFKSDTALLEPFDDGLDILDFPAQNGVSRGSEIGDSGNAHHVRAGLHGQRILIEADKLKAELGFEKGPGFIVVLGDEKSDQVAGREHSYLREEFIGFEE